MSPSASELHVATNLTSLHREPSFLSEMLTQVTHGVALAVLETRDRWAHVEQRDKYRGWVYRPYLTEDAAPESTHVVSVGTLEVRDVEQSDRVLTRLPAGSEVAVGRVEGERAFLRFTGEMLPAGWAAVEGLRALSDLPVPVESAGAQMLKDARRFAGAYYLWGGTTPWGLDCSGLSQLVHRLSGYAIPRDAAPQFSAGRVVEGPPFKPGDLLFFHSDGDRNRITHVGLATGEGWRMIHSSRARNGVYEDDVQQVEHLRQSYAGARTFCAQTRNI